jgi:GT2 family glycosyltransferase
VKVSIVIPTYNHYSLLHQCLYDIYNKCTHVDEVIIVNDNSTDEDVYKGLNWWKSLKMLPLRELRLDKNVMFLKASNIGMKAATGDLIILLSNDVRINHDIVQPIIDAVWDRKSLVGGRLLDWDTGWNTFSGTIYPYLEGWLLAARKETWEQLGYFDERFVPSDMEDVDISTTARLLGYELVAIPYEYTHHLGGQSIGFNPAREEITLKNKQKFKEKWIDLR